MSDVCGGAKQQQVGGVVGAKLWRVEVGLTRHPSEECLERIKQLAAVVNCRHCPILALRSALEPRSILLCVQLRHRSREIWRGQRLVILQEHTARFGANDSAALHHMRRAADAQGGLDELLDQ